MMLNLRELERDVLAEVQTRCTRKCECKPRCCHCRFQGKSSDVQLVCNGGSPVIDPDYEPEVPLPLRELAVLIGTACALEAEYQSNECECDEDFQSEYQVEYQAQATITM